MAGCSSLSSGADELGSLGEYLTGTALLSTFDAMDGW